LIYPSGAAWKKPMMETKKNISLGPTGLPCLRRSSRVSKDMIVNTKQRTIEQEEEQKRNNNNTLHEIKNQSE